MSYNDKIYDNDVNNVNNKAYSDESPEAIKADIARTRQDMGSKIDRIQDRLNPENLKAQAQDAVRDFVDENTESFKKYLSEHSKELGSGMAQAIKRNPIPSALVGLGLGWLLVESLGSSEREQQARRPYYRGEQDWQRYNSGVSNDSYGYESSGPYTSPYTSQGVSSSFAEQYRYNSPDAGAYNSQGNYGYQGGNQGGNQGQSSGRNWAEEKRSEVQGKVEDITHQASDKWHETTDKAQDFAGQARDQAGQLGEQAQQYVGQARQQVSQLGEQVQQQASHVGEQAGFYAQRASEQAGFYAQRAGEQVQRSLEENPLIFGGVALAIGAMVGLALPQTRRENEMMGQWRDEVVGSAQDVAQDALQRAEHVIEEVRPELEQTAQKVAADLKASGSQALTDLQESGRQALDDVKETGKTAVEETKQTMQKAEDKAKTEAEKSAALAKDKAKNVTNA